MRALVLMSLAASLLAGCASPWGTLRLPTGTPREQVLAQAGTPTRVVPLPEGGQRLQYSLQPRGQQAFMVDLDAAGRLVRARQVLTLPEFERIVPGQWSRADVEREFGPPAVARSFAPPAGWTALLDDRAAPLYPRHQPTSAAERALTDSHADALGLARRQT